jgi:hypothetical protein
VKLLELRDTIETVLSMSPNLLGCYVLQNNTTLPAIYVVGRNSVSSEWKVVGLEAAIRQQPSLDPSPGLGIVDLLKQWEVVLTQYKPDGDEMGEAMERMARRFPDADLRYLRGDDVSYERCRIIIPDREIKHRLI